MRGQVMLLTVLILSGTILSATAIAGLLMLYQIRQSADIANSNKAFYAADAGVELATYQLVKNEECLNCSSDESPCPLAFGNDAKIFRISCDSVEEPTGEFVEIGKDAEGNPIMAAVWRQTVTIKSTGEARKNYRSLETQLSREYIP